jgi:type II secretory pathway pseudopilin PulG
MIRQFALERSTQSVKKLLIAMLAVSSLSPAVLGQSRDVRDARREVREQRQDLREARRDLRQERRQDRRENWQRYRNYDYNRPGPGGSYYADQYYRDGRYYKERRLSRNDRVYRGRNGQYYCRRPDGTTGLIVGGVAEQAPGNALDNGRSSTLGTILGAGAGALLGREIDRGGVRCR